MLSNLWLLIIWFGVGEGFMIDVFVCVCVWVWWGGGGGVVGDFSLGPMNILCDLYSYLLIFLSNWFLFSLNTQRNVKQGIHSIPFNSIKIWMSTSSALFSEWHYTLAHFTNFTWFANPAEVWLKGVRFQCLKNETSFDQYYKFNRVPKFLKLLSKVSKVWGQISQNLMFALLEQIQIQLLFALTPNSCENSYHNVKFDHTLYQKRCFTFT